MASAFKKYDKDGRGKIPIDSAIAFIKECYNNLEIKTGGLPENLIINWINEDGKSDGLQEKKAASLLVRSLRLQGFF